jgi:hypothetical protein
MTIAWGRRALKFKSRYARFLCEALESRRLLAAHSWMDGPATPTPAAARPAVRHAALPATGLKQSTGTLDAARWSPVAATAGGMAIFAGGTLSSVYGNFPPVEYFENTGAHSSDTIGVHLTPTAATSVDGQALFFNPPTFQTHASVALFNAAVGGWSDVSLPRDVYSVAATSVGHRAIFAGGFLSNGDSIPSDIADIYDVPSGTWFESRMPVPLGTNQPYATSVAGKALFSDGSIVNIYDTASRLWSTTNVPRVLSGNQAFSVGTKAYFISTSYVGGYSRSSSIEVYDGVSGQWSTLEFPVVFSVDAVSVVGSKVIFAGQYSRYNETGYSVEVYDTAKGSWSSSTLSLGRDSLAATTIGTRAIFAGGKTHDRSGESDAVDIYTDTTPAPVLDGLLSQPVAKRIDVTVRNTGDAPLRAGATINLYAAPADRLYSRDHLLATVRLPRPLAGGDSSTLTLYLSKDARSLPAGTSLIAVVKSRRSTTAIASVSLATPSVASSGLGAGDLLITPTLPPVLIGGNGVGVDSKIIFSTSEQSGASRQYGIEVFDTSSATWSTLPLTHSLGNNHAVADHLAFFAGSSTSGDSFFSPSIGSDVVDIYHADTGQLSTAHLSLGRLTISVVNVGTKVLFAGGYKSRYYFGGTDPTNVVDVYDTQTGQWSTATLSSARGDLTGVVVGTKAIFAGGSYENRFDVYDAATNTWSSGTIPASGVVNNGVAVGNKALFTDGTTAYLYDPTSGAWTTHSISLKYSYGLSFLSTGGRAFITGIYTMDAQGNPIQSKLLDIYDSTTSAWTSTQVPHLDLYFKGIIFDGKPAYVIDLGRNRPARVDVYDPDTGLWSSTARPSGYDSGEGIGIAGNELLVSDYDYNGTSTVPDILTPSPVAAPRNLLPADGVLLASPPEHFSWTPSTGADSYDIYLDDTLVINVPSPEWTPSPAIISGTHTWRVVARYGASRLGSADSTFTVLAPA